jgi:hypothetical protein
VLPPIVLYWQDEPDQSDLDAFIEKRLQNAMTFGKWGSKIAKPGLQLWDRLRGGRPDG